MSKVPCRKCKKCGYYHDFTIMTCRECGENIENLPISLIESDDIPGEVFGEIETTVFFVQKCSACGVLNFTTDKNNRVKVCYNCHKTRIASIEPTEYIEDSETERKEETPIKENIKPNYVPASVADSDTEPIRISDEDDDNDSPWPGILRKSVEKKVRESGVIPEKKEDPQFPEVSPQADPDDNDDDDEEPPRWSSSLGNIQTPSKAVEVQNKSITLSALRYGCLTFTIKPNPNEKYMLGRSANQSEFLNNDSRVSNNHCFLSFRNGSWYVKDNHSSNGTAVNSRDLGLDGECMLNDGDELKLGHHPDSMAFRITIR